MIGIKNPNTGEMTLAVMSAVEKIEVAYDVCRGKVYNIEYLDDKGTKQTLVVPAKWEVVV